MRWTQTLIPTQKETPADAQIVSHQLMLRAGLVRQLTAGAYDFLPLGWRSLHKALVIVREEMDAIGAAEVLLPALQPADLWQKTGRDVGYGDNLMKFQDRHGRVNVLGPTHEEVVTELVAGYVSSYKQLPLTLYQIQTKFRDEYRPRFGLLRVREFLMKDAYSFHADLETLDKTYQDVYRAYERIFTRCGIPFVVVEAESGPIGGSGSHEFMANCDAGEDTLLSSDKGNYAANVEKAETGPRPHNFDGDPKGALEKVHTPGLPGIGDVGKFMKVKPKNMLKTLVCWSAGNQQWVVAVVRGDHDLNEAKLRKAVGDPSLALADESKAREAGFAIGFVGPHAMAGKAAATVVVDFDAAQGDAFWAAGANEVDYHLKYFNWKRDYFAAADIHADAFKGNQTEWTADGDVLKVADIRNAAAGDLSPKNDGGVLRASKGIEIGHVFKLGTKYSDALGAQFEDANRQKSSIIMGCYGIGIGRILIAAIEAFHDDKGIRWPVAIAPYSVVVTPIRYETEIKAAADAIYSDLNRAGIDTILDDRDARPGVKFADADLVGFPVRITVGDRGLKEGKVELKRRRAADPEMVKIGDIETAVRQALVTG